MDDHGGMEGYDSTTYGERFAAVYDLWYPTVSDVDGTVAKVAALAADSSMRRRSAQAGSGPAEFDGTGSVLELGIGTGRLALPLAAAGLSVTGIDSSPAMLELFRAKPEAERIHILEGDMTRPDDLTSAVFDVALVAFNTFFNVASEAGQGRCLAGITHVLHAGGFLVLETFVPDEDQPLAAVSPTRVTADHVVLTATQVDPVAQTIRGQHIDITEAGTRLRPWFLRYASPTQLDAAAAGAGLALVERCADWHGAPFTEDSLHHVSVYRKS